MALVLALSWFMWSLISFPVVLFSILSNMYHKRADCFSSFFESATNEYYTKVHKLLEGCKSKKEVFDMLKKIANK